MHPDPAPHLHSDECNRCFEALFKCHKENPYKKYLGHCNELRAALDSCLRREREDNRKFNKLPVRVQAEIREGKATAKTRGE